MPRETPSPIDLPGPARVSAGSGLAWAAAAIAIATLFLLVANAVSLQGWIDEQRPGPVQAWAAERADAWVAFTDRIGVGRPRAVLHARWKQVEEARFGAAARGGDEPAGQR